MGKIKKEFVHPNKITDEKQDGYPIFCFKYLMDEPKRDPKNKDGFYAQFIARLKKLSNLGWNGINTSGRHGFGYEKIPIGQINKTNFPSLITPEIKDLMVFRATGDNRAFLGIRSDNDVFHVIFIEEDFNKIYKHGK